MTVVVGVGGSAGSRAAIRLAAQEAGYRGAPLLAVMSYSGERALGAPAARPVATLRTGADERVVTDAMLHDIVRDALGAEADGVSYRTIAGLRGRALITAAREAGAQLIPGGTKRRPGGACARAGQPACAAPRPVPGAGRSQTAARPLKAAHHR